MECDYRVGTTQEDAFDEAFALMEIAETYGLDGMWLAERLVQLREALGLTGVVLEPNVGGSIPRERAFESVCLFAQEVVPRLR
jgi:alkanesulfonate monooxygenase SsuD/methylene tetrahydromethanopterin reductase-like flavin-dependent oxidoreductase (luciferase family)